MKFFKNKKIIWPVFGRNIIILLLLIFIAFDFDLSINNKKIDNEIIEYEAYKIQYAEYKIADGDTLWSIALENKKEDMDVREYIYIIQNDNIGLNAGNLQIGQVIKIRK